MPSLEALTTHWRQLIAYSLNFIEPQFFTLLQSEPANAVVAQIEGHACRVPHHAVSTARHLSSEVATMHMLTEAHDPLVAVINALDQSHVQPYFICLKQRFYLSFGTARL